MATVQAEVVEVRRAAVGPMVDMVDVAPPMRAVASGELAVPVPGHDGPAEWLRRHADPASHLEGFAVGSEDDPVDRSVAGNATDGSRGEDVA